MSFHMPGEVLGLDALGVDSYDSSALTLEYTSLCVIPFTTLKLIPDSHHYLYKLLSSAVARDHRTIELIARKDAEAKLAIFLLDMSQAFPRSRVFCARFQPEHEAQRNW